MAYSKNIPEGEQSRFSPDNRSLQGIGDVTVSTVLSVIEYALASYGALVLYKKFTSRKKRG